MRIGVLFSGGKDSVAALMLAAKHHTIACLITIMPDNSASYMFHKPGTAWAHLQAEALGIPLLVQRTAGEQDAELKDLEKAVERAKKEHHIEGIVTGAVASVYQATRIQRICDELNLWCFNPLWLRPQDEHLRAVVDTGIVSIITLVAAEGLGKDWIGRTIDKKVAEQLIALQKTKGIYAAGEGGEFETFVLDCPLYRKRIVLSDSSVVWNKDSGYLDIKKAGLEPR